MVKRLLLLLLCLAVFSGCALAEEPLRGYDPEAGYVYVALGQYPQTAEAEVRPILWRVLSADPDRIYLLSEYILFAHCIHGNLKQYRDEFRGDFGQTDLCAYLNSTFAEEAFPGGETGMLLPFEGIGIVFIPSEEDLLNTDYGLGKTLVNKKSPDKIRNNPGLRAWGTEYAIKNNGFDPSVYTSLNKKYEGSSKKQMPLKELRLFVYSNQWANHSPYWTRTQSKEKGFGTQARRTYSTGVMERIEVGRDNIGVRPAVYLNPEAFVILAGDGTAESPYQLGVKADDPTP